MTTGALKEAARPGGGSDLSSELPRTDGWHLDKRVPLAIIFTILVQSGSAIWYAAELANQVKQHSHDIARIERDFAGRRNEDREALKDFVREVRETLRRIEDKLGDKVDRPRP